MSLKLLHTSDLHGNWRFLTAQRDFDIWADTGDFFPNITRGEKVEKTFQTMWFTRDRLALRRAVMPELRKRYGSGAPSWYPSDRRQPPFHGTIAKRIVEWLDGRPVVTVGGNHDFTNLASLLRRAGHRDVWDVSREPIEIEGQCFAGFGEVDWMAGEWAGEEHDLRPFIYKALKAKPDVLLTHTPPCGILDGLNAGGGHVGSSALTTALTYQPHDIKLALCGHVHEQGGKTFEKMGIVFSNAAQTASLLSVGNR